MDLGMLKTTWDFQRSINEAHTVIRVRNLQTSLRVETDAWGRRGRLQPVLISATLSLREPFESASGQDSVTSSTVHYGILSKAILEACDNCSHSTYSREAGTESTLMWHILRIIFVHLTQTERFGGQNVVLQTSLIQTLELELLLPKASVIGTGVSLKFATAFNNTAATSSAYRVAMSIHHLRVPTLIGVNSNERYAKQIVIANVELDCWAVEQGGRYCELEEIVVKTIEESSFQTLEALSLQICRRVIKFFILPYMMQDSIRPSPKVRVSLEKPIAVTFADAPVVEMMLDSAPFQDVLELWGSMARKQLPFPLEGNLGEWIRENCPGDTT